jgi:excisionase family DNA binding protein
MTTPDPSATESGETAAKPPRGRAAKPEIPQPKFLSVPEAAKICGVSRNTVYAWVRQGKLGAYQTPGRTNLIRPSDLVKFMHQNGMFVPSSLVEIARIDDKQSSGGPRETTDDAHEHTVLVADDDPITRSLAVRAIHENCQVYQAETGYEALHLLTLHKDIDIILLDLRMPGQHGTETLSEIRELRPDVAIVIITGFSGDLPAEVANNEMVVKTIEKPFTMPLLRESIEEAERLLAARGRIA